jgi:hypothetical protein
MEAEIKDNKAKASTYYNMYRTIKASTKPSNTPKPSAQRKLSPEASGKEELNGGLDAPTPRAKENSGNKSTVEELKFTTGALPKHDEMGFTPYFDNNIRKLKVPILLTIFNKMWNNAAILFHSKKRAKVKDSIGDWNHYTGFP